MTEESRPNVLGRYMIWDEIGAGGMATVHLGRVLGAAGFSRVVAIKRLHPHLLDSGKLTAMLIDEARIASRIRHPKVVSTIDVERVADELLLVMEYVHGPSLAWVQSNLRLRGKTMPVPIALRICLDVLEGLHAAHNAKSERGQPLNIVHRDVSPQNILVGAQDGIARLTDFGIAKAEGRVSFTHDGEIKGKLSYMSREQLLGERGEQVVDLRSDIYSIGVVLWEMLTGQRLFVLDSASAPAKAARAAAATATMTMTGDAARGGLPTLTESPSAIAAAEAAAAAWANTNPSAKNPIELLLMMTADKPPSAFVPSISPTLDAIVMKALHPNPSERFTDAEAMSAALAAAAAAANLSTTKDVAEWIRNIAGAFLLQREEIVARIEQISMIIPGAPGAAATQSSPQTGVPSTSPMDHTLSIEPKTPAVAPTLIDAPLVVPSSVAEPPTTTTTTTETKTETTTETKTKTKTTTILLVASVLVVATVAIVMMIGIAATTQRGAPQPAPSAVPGVESENPGTPPAKRRPNRRHPPRQE
jgi:eukaryotic-like serine/threonine-protein kinase